MILLDYPVMTILALLALWSGCGLLILIRIPRSLWIQPKWPVWKTCLLFLLCGPAVWGASTCIILYHLQLLRREAGKEKSEDGQKGNPSPD